MDIQFEIFLKLLETVNYNQSEFARIVGKPPERVSEWKNGKHVPSFKQLLVMADKLGYNLNVELVKQRKIGKARNL